MHHHRLFRNWDKLDDYERRGEWECVFADEIGGSHMDFREHLKRVASDRELLDKTPKDYLGKLAVHIVLAYYLRSLESSDYSPMHPSFGQYAAVSFHNWRVSPLRIDPDIYGSEWLDELCQKYKAHPDEHMLPGKSYWNFTEAEISQIDA